MSHAISTPIYFENRDQDSVTICKLLQKSDNSKNALSEDDIQSLIFEYPQLLPVEKIEPSFDELIPVCRELPTACGPIDNLFVTPRGFLVIVECKLWRNPEARRKVLGQVMDYAKEIAQWGYSDLREAINKRRKTHEENPLYALALSRDPDLDEAKFVDRVSRNLRLGRHLLLIVGDGIHEGAENLTNFMQQHMGLHFTLGMVELQLYRVRDERDLLIVPHVLMKTTCIERAVIRVEGSSNHVILDEAKDNKIGKKPRAQNLSEEEYYEQLEENCLGATTWLKNILPRLEEIGVCWDIKKSIMLSWPYNETLKFGLFYIDIQGWFNTEYANWKMRDIGRTDLSYNYQQSLADIIEGGYVKKVGKEFRTSTATGMLNIRDLIGKEEQIFEAIRNYVDVLKAEAFE